MTRDPVTAAILARRRATVERAIEKRMVYLTTGPLTDPGYLKQVATELQEYAVRLTELDRLAKDLDIALPAPGSDTEG